MFTATADVNHDGNADVITWNKMFSATSVSRSVLLGTGDGTLQPRIDQPIDQGLIAVATVDVDRDGNADLVEVYTSSTGGGVVRVQRSRGDGTFRADADYPTSGMPGRIATADLNGDGTADLAVLGDGNTVSVLLGNADGTFRHGADHAVGPSAQLVSLADVNADGTPDLLVHVTANAPDGGSVAAVTVMRGIGDGTFGPGASYATSLYPASIAVADVTGDGVADLVLGPAFIDVVSVLPGDGAGGFQPQIVLAANNDYPAPRVLAVVDITGDGKPDLVMSGGGVLVATCLP